MNNENCNTNYKVFFQTGVVGYFMYGAGMNCSAGWSFVKCIGGNYLLIPAAGKLSVRCRIFP